MSKYEYNPWPLDKLPETYQRPEPQLIREKGYRWDDPRDIVDIWERKVADFWGAKHAVAVDCCSHAMFLSLRYIKLRGEVDILDTLIFPTHTYISAPMQAIHAGLRVKFKDFEWEGCYQIEPTRVIDAAVMWEKDAYIPKTLMCLSFQIKKAVPIGKGGMILTDDPKAAKVLKLMSYDGRDLTTPYDSKNHVKMMGYHYYQTPEDCARGILLMDQVGNKGRYMGNKNYPDVSQMLNNI